MTKASELWFLVADSEHARLLHGTLTKQGTRHVDEASRLASTFQAGEHHRPSRLSQPGRSGPPGHEHDEKVAHFAREVSGWLGKEIAARSLAQCTVFAPSHFLGALRKQTPKALAAKLQEQTAEIAGLSPGALATHPKVAELFGG